MSLLPVTCEANNGLPIFLGINDHNEIGALHETTHAFGILKEPTTYGFDTFFRWWEHVNHTRSDLVDILWFSPSQKQSIAKILFVH